MSLIDVRRTQWLLRGTTLGGLAVTLAGCGVWSSGIPPTVTPYPFVTASPRPIATLPPATPTSPPLPTPSLPPPTPTLRGGPVVPTIGPEDRSTPVPSPTVPGVTGECPVLPEGGFRIIFESDPGLRPAIGCPASQRETDPPQLWTVDTLWQPFEGGTMLWSSAVGWEPTPVVYVLYDDGTYQRIDDTYKEGVDPLNGGLAPPPGLFEPQGRLGKVWREGPDVSARLGWATTPESPEEGPEFTQMQVFTNGEVIFVRQVGLMYVFKHAAPNTWWTYDVNF